jgi:enoyl-CoA hydratase/carnithine racemase
MMPANISSHRIGHVAVVAIDRPPHNFVTADLMGALADLLETFDADIDCRAIVLTAHGKTFCAGADLSGEDKGGVNGDPTLFYAQAMRLFRTTKPIVAAVGGAAIGAGLGLAVMADFRVSCKEARFSANFNRLGFHPGFGLSVTLPRLVGEQQAALLFYTGRRIDGAQAMEIGLVDQLVAPDEVVDAAVALATEIAGSAPLAVQSTRATLRNGLADQILAVNQRELAMQRVQFQTDDFHEGVTAMAQRRPPVFTSR